MKKIIIAVLAIMVCNSCGTTLWLTGEYKTTSYSIETSKSEDVIWSNIVDWFFETQTPIELIDKDSGIITSGRISLRSSSTYEINNQPGDVSKYVVLPNGTMNYTDMRVYGRVMARVKSGNGKTKISVFLGDIECVIGNSSYIEAKSLGTFEQNWLKYISNK
jgi:hypothetical protein